ncbi:MAG: phosphoribosylglycinamide formyltransferase [Candidatus Accumulibacter sp.]|jgi:phosphoribosylglycinamide formyltransferase-1|nr:phosphoribosylglycinamide formyltransferase [Accumulibacter sp.]
MKSVVILISGRGSNMAALIDAAADGALPVRVAGVLSNRPGAPGLEIAARRGIPARAVDHARHPRREAFDAALAEAIDAWAPDIVALAGFMRILGDDFVARYAGRLINIHPSLLPAFPGLHTHQRALDAGVRVHGCTVHFVTPALDHGPIIAQAAVPVLDGDDADSLAARVLAQEHRLYPQAIRWFAEDRLRLIGARVALDAAQEGGASLVSPRVSARG